MKSRFGVLDETMCKAPVCPHPQCWMTFRRLECGAARFRPVEETSVRVPEEEERLPVLTVCHLSKAQPPASGHDLYAPASPLSSIAAQALGINEGQESERRKCLAPRRTRTKVGMVDVSLAPAGFQDAENRQTSLVWIPNSRCKSLKPSQEEEFIGEETLKIGIKDFTLETVTCGNEKSKARNRAAQKYRNGKRFPTGRCLNVSPRGAQLPAKGSSKNRISERSAKEKHEEPSGSKRDVCGRSQSVRCLQLPITSFPKPENRRLVLHDTKERSLQCVPSPVPTSVYKLDDKVPGNLSVKEVDLESIRNQYYLWKKYSSVADGSGRISTSALDPQLRKRQTSRAHTGLTALRIIGDIGLFPRDPQPAPRPHEDLGSKGSVRSNTALSCDASFGSFSPSPRTDPDSQVVQRSSPESPCYEEVSEPAQASAPLHDMRDPPTMDPPVQTEPKICDLDLKPPEQRPPSTQPDPPPPSPTHTSQ